MQIKKHFNSITAVFNTNNDKLEMNNQNILEDIFLSLENVIVVEKNIRPEKLMELNQSGMKPLIINGETRQLDSIRILLKLVSNFFIHTNQVQDFTLEYIETNINDTTIIAYGSEVYQDDLRQITFSPTIRSKWRNPQMFNTLIEMS